MAGTLVVDSIESGSGVSQGTNPTGTVIMYYGSAAPTGYLECNGQSTSGFDDLETLIGANVPDLRGEFIRGWDNGRGVDTGRALGSTQDDEFESHLHGETASLAGAGAQIGSGAGVLNAVSYTRDTSETGGTETRPRNVALMYCIKH